MIDVSDPLQTSVFATLRADERLIALFRGLENNAADLPRVYDRIPADSDGKVTATFPFISFGDDLVLDDGDTCHEGAKVYFGLDIWSRAVGRGEVKRLAAAVAAALDVDLVIEGHQVITHKLESIRPAPGGDGLTKHRVVTLVYQTAPIF